MASSLLYGAPQPRHAARVERREEQRQERNFESGLDELIAAAFDFCEKTGPRQFEVASSIALHDPSSAKRKRYRGFIEIGFNARMGKTVFTPVTKYGPRARPESQGGPILKGIGQDLDKVLKVVNKQLQVKQSKTYVPLDENGPKYAEITRADVAKGLAKMLGRDQG